MKLGNKLTSLRVSKRLKELGVPQESEHFWIRDKDGLGWGVFATDIATDLGVENCSAFDVAELGERLPFRQKYLGTTNDALLISMKFTHLEGLDKRVSSYLCGYFDEDVGYPPMCMKIEFMADTEAEARGQLLIWLIENKHHVPN